MTDLDPVAVEAAISANQHASELDFMVRLLRPRCPRRVLEIGCESGWSLWAWLQVAADDAQAMGVDAEWHSSMFSDLMAKAPWPARERQTLRLFKGDSRAADTVQAVHDWATTPVDWLFIDADHSYEAAKQDWDNYRPLVAKGGLVGFHDIANQAAEIWAEVRAGWRTSEFVDPDNAGMGVGCAFID